MDLSVGGVMPLPFYLRFRDIHEIVAIRAILQQPLEQLAADRQDVDVSAGAVGFGEAGDQRILNAPV